MVIEPKLLGGRFSDRGRAQDAFDVLMGSGEPVAESVDVAFYGSEGEYLLLVVAKATDAENWAARVLREHGATVQEEQSIDWLRPSGSQSLKQAAAPSAPRSEQGELRTRWATLAILLMEQGVLEPPDLLALLLTSHRLPDTVPGDEKRRRLREADQELREVTEHLEASLHARHPDLFDRRGRLRPAALVRHLAARTGGKDILSGDELRVLEDAADAAAARSGRAP